MASQLSRRIVDRYLQATEFDTPEALQEYLKKHPKADKAKHSVKKKDQKDPSKGDESKGDESKSHPSLSKGYESTSKAVSEVAESAKNDVMGLQKTLGIAGDKIDLEQIVRRETHGSDEEKTAIKKVVEKAAERHKELGSKAEQALKEAEESIRKASSLSPSAKKVCTGTHPGYPEAL